MGASDAGEPELRGVKRGREFVGEAGGEGADCAEPIDTRLSSLGFREPHLQLVEGTGESSSQNPENEDDDDLRREKDIGGDKRPGKRRGDMAVELDDHEAGEEQAEEGEAEAPF